MYIKSGPYQYHFRSTVWPWGKGTKKIKSYDLLSISMNSSPVIVSFLRR